MDLSTRLGQLQLRSPLIAASGTVGSVKEMVEVAPLDRYGAMVAKSVSGEPWAGRPAPRLAPAGHGMLNGIGIQNPGIEAWADDMAPRLATLPVPVWGSAVGSDAEEFARVAKGLEGAGVAAIEINLSCPNLEQGSMFALDAAAAGRVVQSVRAAVSIPIGAKLSPNASDIVAIADAVATAGADFVTLTNTIWGAGIDIETRAPLLSGVVGGYSGAPLKPISLRCVLDVSRALPDLPIAGCGGVRTGSDVVEYLMAGASAVELGTVHFAEPNAAERITRELMRWMKRHRVGSVAELVGSVHL